MLLKITVVYFEEFLFDIVRTLYGLLNTGEDPIRGDNRHFLFVWTRTVTFELISLGD